jgi:hypothetical protein
MDTQQDLKKVGRGGGWVGGRGEGRGMVVATRGGVPEGWRGVLLSMTLNTEKAFGMENRGEK